MEAQVSSIIDRNRERDVYLRHEEQDHINVIMIPRGWCDAFTANNGFPGGLDSEDRDIYCWAPTLLQRNSTIETLWVALRDLQRCEEITEREARHLHPAMFEHFAMLTASTG